MAGAARYLSSGFGGFYQETAGVFMNFGRQRDDLTLNPHAEFYFIDPTGSIIIRAPLREGDNVRFKPSMRDCCPGFWGGVARIANILKPLPLCSG